MGAQLACGVKTTRLSLTYGKEKILYQYMLFYVKGKRICGGVDMFENLERFQNVDCCGTNEPCADVERMRVE